MYMWAREDTDKQRLSFGVGDQGWLKCEAQQDELTPWYHIKLLHIIPGWDCKTNGASISQKELEFRGGAYGSDIATYIGRWVLSTKGHWHQFNTNRNSQFWMWWDRKLFSAKKSNVMQHSCENSMAVRMLWGQAALGPHPSQTTQLYSAPHWSALLSSVLFCSTLLWGDIFSVSVLAREMQSSMERENVPPEPEGSWLT